MHQSYTSIGVLARLKFPAGVIAAALVPGLVHADEPGIFGRFFRAGSTTSTAPASAKPNAMTANGGRSAYPRPASSPTANSPAPGLVPTLTQAPVVSNFDGLPASGPSPEAGLAAAEVSTPRSDPAAEAAMPKLTPRSRVNRPITNAEPVLTRFSLGRSNDGSQFAMFLEIFADGTVLDSEGVHHIRPADIKPVLEAVQAADFSKIRGHSGAPPTDFIDHVQVIVFDRRLGRLTAHPFSYSGNPQGCDAAIRHLHVALEGLQLKLSGAGQPAVSATEAEPAKTPRPDSNLAPTGLTSTSALPGNSSNVRPLPVPTLPSTSVGPKAARPANSGGSVLPGITVK